MHSIKTSIIEGRGRVVKNGIVSLSINRGWNCRRYFSTEVKPASSENVAAQSPLSMIHFFGTTSDPFQQLSFPMPTIRSVISSLVRPKVRNLFGLDLFDSGGWRKAADLAIAEAEKSPNQAVEILDRVRIPARFCRNFHVDEDVANEADLALQTLDRAVSRLAPIVESSSSPAFPMELLQIEQTHVSEFAELCDLNTDAAHPGPVVAEVPYGLIVPSMRSLMGLDDKDAEDSRNANSGRVNLNEKMQIRERQAVQFIPWISSSRVRAELYLAAYGISPRREAVLKKLMDVRREIAMSMGRKAYSDLFLDHEYSPVRSHSQAVRIASALCDGNIAKRAKQELIRLSSRKLADEKNSMLHPWDVGYYVRSGFDGTESDPSYPSPYLSFGAVLAGLEQYLRETMKIQIDITGMNAGESWLPSVRKLTVSTPKDGVIGELYLDMLQRPRKSRSGAHIITQADTKKNVLTKVCILGQVVYPKRNFPALFSYHDLVSFFNSMGTALHILFGDYDRAKSSTSRSASSVRFDGVCGRAMELFAKNYKVVSLCGVHHETGKRLSETAFRNWLLASESYAGIQMQTSLLTVLTDLALHGGNAIESPVQVMRELHAKHTALPQEPKTMWLLRERSLATEGGHLFLKTHSPLLTRRVWIDLMGRDPLDPSAGSEFVDRFLRSPDAEDFSKRYRLAQQDIQDLWDPTCT